MSFEVLVPGPADSPTAARGAGIGGRVRSAQPMKPWIRYGLIAVTGILMTIAAGYYWLIVESHAPSQTRYVLDISTVRRLAGSLPGDKPSAIEVERVAVFRFPATAVVDGDG